MSEEAKAGDALLFSFPYWIFCVQTEAFPISTVRVKDLELRVYPPFRSAKANFTLSPQINAQRIPFEKGKAPNIDPKFQVLNLSVLPNWTDEGEPKGLNLVWGEDWDEQPVVMPMDSLRVDALNGGNETSNDKAANFVSLFIAHLRMESRQWWIGRSVDALLGNHKAAFAIDREGAALETPIGYSRGRSPFGFERPISLNNWEQCLNKASQDQKIPETQVLISDSYFFTASGDLRRAILDAATAAELAKDLAIERAWKTKNRGKSYKRGKVLKGYEVPLHLKIDLKELTGHSFEDADPNSFSKIDRLWKLRGKIAHGLPLTFSSGRGTESLNEKSTAEMVSATENLIQWLEQIE